MQGLSLAGCPVALLQGVGQGGWGSGGSHERQGQSLEKLRTVGPHTGADFVEASIGKRL
jgi:hypothetical protein